MRKSFSLPNAAAISACVRPYAAETWRIRSVPSGCGMPLGTSLIISSKRSAASSRRCRAAANSARSIRKIRSRSVGRPSAYCIGELKGEATSVAIYVAVKRLTARSAWGRQSCRRAGFRAGLSSRVARSNDIKTHLTDHAQRSAAHRHPASMYKACDSSVSCWQPARSRTLSL
jgi:hypothetical protein